jgi:hypothetical protein
MTSNKAECCSVVKLKMKSSHNATLNSVSANNNDEHELIFLCLLNSVLDQLC